MSVVIKVVRTNVVRTNVIRTNVFKTNVVTPANALKIAQRHPDRMESFINIHNNLKRATPNNLMVFKHTVLLHKLFNNQTPPP